MRGALPALAGGLFEPDTPGNEVGFDAHQGPRRPRVPIRTEDEELHPRP
jgi:hypothetical protein